jgi:hypothetical protein
MQQAKKKYADRRQSRAKAKPMQDPSARAAPAQVNALP